MPFLPEWAPNVHPLIVHFPIALLFTAFVLDLGAVFWKSTRWPAYAAGTLYILGAVALVSAFFSGREAADAVAIPAQANPVLTHHADWAQYTLWFFGFYTFVRVAAFSAKWYERRAAALAVFLVSIPGQFLLFETAEHGAELVFRHGVGVQAATEARSQLDSLRQEREALVNSGLTENDDGSWQWIPTGGAPVVLERRFQWLRGKPEQLPADTVLSSGGNTLLVLYPKKTGALITFGRTLQSVQMDLEIDRSDFEGTVALVHHIQDSASFDFVRLVGNRMELGRMTDGDIAVEAQGAVAKDGWTELRAVADGTHFRGYIDENLITHGHGEELPAGPVGLWIEGSGRLLIKRMTVTALR